MSAQPFLFGSDSPWIRVRDANNTALQLFSRHYSARKNRNRKTNHFCGPGESMVLLTEDALAIFVWRAERFRQDGQVGINCSIFRNEGTSSGKSSDLIRAACAEANARWPGERMYTFVDESQVRHKRDPGRCFIRAGFQRCGTSKGGKLIFEFVSHQEGF